MTPLIGLKDLAGVDFESGQPAISAAIGVQADLKSQVFDISVPLRRVTAKDSFDAVMMSRFCGIQAHPQQVIGSLLCHLEIRCVIRVDENGVVRFVKQPARFQEPAPCFGSVEKSGW